jgi:hypothetical protein
MNITDHGEDDPLPFDLGSWKPVGDEARKVIKELFGRELTEVPEEK